MRQFGILKSVGATQRQISDSVVAEGLIISAIGIPVGIAVGLALEALTLSVSNNFLASFGDFVTNTGMSKSGAAEANVNFNVTLSWEAILVAVVVSFLTILISAWRPARRAAKVSAIEAINLSNEIKITQWSVRTSRLTAKLFGFEGTLASKALKRSRRQYRATVAAIVISIILFLVATAFGNTLRMMAETVSGAAAAGANTVWQDVMTLVMIFIYGFIAMMSLIGITSVISAISTNVRLRAREFAMLASVGMTPESRRRMLNLESVFYAAKSLIIGLPIGILLSYLIYMTASVRFNFGYAFPWLSVLICTGAVFLLAFATMRYSSSRLKHSSIVETLKDANI
jgi:ABC-type antimicrobial peptide transport system permease subunit